MGKICSFECGDPEKQSSADSRGCTVHNFLMRKVYSDMNASCSIGSLINVCPRLLRPQKLLTKPELEIIYVHTNIMSGK